MGRGAFEHPIAILAEPPQIRQDSARDIKKRKDCQPNDTRKIIIWGGRSNGGDITFGAGHKIATVGYVLGFSAAALAVSAGLGNRFGLWTFREGFDALSWLVYVGAAAAVISAIGLFVGFLTGRRGLTMVLALAGLVLGAAVVWIPYDARMALKAGPRLSDITTDTVNPPAFVKIIPLREAAKARNTTDYTRDKAALQAKYYPDLKPLMLAKKTGSGFRHGAAGCQTGPVHFG
jgi:hypothetical protein